MTQYASMLPYLSILLKYHISKSCALLEKADPNFVAAFVFCFWAGDASSSLCMEGTICFVNIMCVLIH